MIQPNWVVIPSDSESEFLGFGKVARERRRGRIARLKEEADSKAYARRKEADAAFELAKQGIPTNKQSNFEKFVNGAAKVAGAVGGGRNQDEQTSSQMPEPKGFGGSNQEVQPEAKKPFYKTPVGMAAIGGGVLVVVGILYFALKKN
jgi:hypothetical protein